MELDLSRSFLDLQDLGQISRAVTVRLWAQIFPQIRLGLQRSQKLESRQDALCLSRFDSAETQACLENLSPDHRALMHVWLVGGVNPNIVQHRWNVDVSPLCLICGLPDT